MDLSKKRAAIRRAPMRSPLAQTSQILPHFDTACYPVRGQVYELLDILTGLASFEGRVLRPTIVSYS
jgi:hypothetical protein